MATANERSSTAGGAIKNFMTTGRMQLIIFIYLGISELAIVLTRPGGAACLSDTLSLCTSSIHWAIRSYLGRKPAERGVHMK